MCSVIVAAELIAASAPLGCSGKPRAVSDRSQIMATYSWGALSVDLAGATPVLTLQAAAESALRSRGYSVDSASSTADTSRVRAKKPGAGLLESVVVDCRVVNGGSRVSVKFEPFGDEQASRAVMDQILASLGK